METKLIQSLASFISLQYGLPETDFFRGQSSTEYQLIPSIGRLFKEGQESVLKQYEREIFDDFKRKYSVDSNGTLVNDGPYYLAVLIAYQLTAKSQVGVDYRGKNTVKSVQNEKYTAKSADFFRFMLYLCHVIDDFACLDLQH